MKNWMDAELLDMYDQLKTARVFCMSMEKSVYAGLIRSSFHTPLGQEARNIALATGVKKTDWLGYTHRGQILLYSRFGLLPLITEVFALSGGQAKGAGFDFHLSDYSEDGARVLGQPGTLGSANPKHVGFALARKMQGKDEVVVSPLGDGACSEGYIYEAWNMAVLYKAPIVFVLENNGWGLSVPVERQHGVTDFAAKGKAFGLKTIEVKDGCDVLEIREAVETASEWARNGEPSLVVVNDLRWGPHFVGEPDDYRPDKPDVAKAKEDNDCVKKMENILLKKNIATQDYFDKKEREVMEMMDEVYKKAAESAMPKSEYVYFKENIYATPITGGEL